MTTETLRKFEGFYFWFNGKDYFVVSNRKRITDKFVADICNKIGYNIHTYLKGALLKGICELKRGNIGGNIITFYDINGDSFGGYGTLEHDGYTVLVFL